jgi:hypothetical protein
MTVLKVDFVGIRSDRLGDVQHADGVSWQHFHCPDGTVLEISGPANGANAPATSS